MFYNLKIIFLLFSLFTNRFAHAGCIDLAEAIRPSKFFSHTYESVGFSSIPEPLAADLKSIGIGREGLFSIREINTHFKNYPLYDVIVGKDAPLDSRDVAPGLLYAESQRGVLVVNPSDVINISKSQDRVSISVIDSGIGVPEDILKSIFSMNKQTNRIGTEGEKGSGFGMQLVKSFVEDLDGKVEIFSSTTNGKRLNKGTIVVVEFQQFRRKVEKVA